MLHRSIVAPTGRHTASLIFLHGSGDTGIGIQSWVEECFDRIGDKRGFKFKHIEVIYPTAPPQPYTLLDGSLSNVWHDREKISYDSPEKRESMDAMAEKLSEIVQAEKDCGIPAKRIIMGGLSMGGSMALQFGYKIHPDLRGVFALSTYQNPQSSMYDALRERRRNVGEATTPDLFMAHGTRDELVLFEWGQKTFEKLKSLGVKGHFHTFDYYHEIGSEEMVLLRSWVQDMLPENVASNL